MKLEFSLGAPARVQRHAVDRLGAAASGACAFHCALCGLLPGILTSLGLGSLLGHEAEWAFTLLAVALAALTLVIGFRRHRSGRVAMLLLLGIAGLLGSRLLEEWGGHAAGTILGLLAGSVLVIGHLSNIRAARCCQPSCA